MIYTKRGVPLPAIGNWDLIGGPDVENVKLRDALNGDKGMSDEERREVITDTLTNKVIPMLAAFETKDGLTKYSSSESPLVSTGLLRKWLSN